MRVSEIAQRAGVSIATVSRVLNDNPSVRPETALQVRKILDQFPYDRHAVRRGPRPGKRPKSRTPRSLRHNRIAIVVLGLPHERWFQQPVFGSIVSSITRAAADRHLAVRIEEVLDVNRISDGLHGDVADGALAFVASAAKPELLEAVRGRLPVVRMMGDDLVPAAVDQVRVDNLEVGHLAFQYLASRGCKHMACITSRPDHGGLYLRTMALTAAAARAGLPRPTLYKVGPTAAGPWFGQDAIECKSFDAVADHLAAASPRPTGLFVTQDVETVAFYPSLMSHGLRPGRDVQVVSCNNDHSLALLTPQPASVDVNPAAIGRWALRRLLNRIERPDDSPIQMLIKPSLRTPEIGEPL